MHNDDLIVLVHRCIDESPRILRIESDVSTLKSGVSTLKSDVSTLKSDVSTLAGSVKTLETESHRQGVLMEAMRDHVNKILEVVMRNDGKLERVQNGEETLERHSIRLEAVEKDPQGTYQESLSTSQRGSGGR